MIVGDDDTVLLAQHILRAVSRGDGGRKKVKMDEPGVLEARNGGSAHLSSGLFEPLGDGPSCDSADIGQIGQ